MNLIAGCYNVKRFIVTGQKCVLEVSAVNEISFIFFIKKDHDADSSVYFLTQAS